MVAFLVTSLLTSCGHGDVKTSDLDPIEEFDPANEEGEKSSFNDRYNYCGAMAFFPSLLVFVLTGGFPTVLWLGGYATLTGSCLLSDGSSNGSNQEVGGR